MIIYFILFYKQVLFINQLNIIKKSVIFTFVYNEYLSFIFFMIIWWFSFNKHYLFNKISHKYKRIRLQTGYKKTHNIKLSFCYFFQNLLKCLLALRRTKASLIKERRMEKRGAASKRRTSLRPPSRASRWSLRQNPPQRLIAQGVH